MSGIYNCTGSFACKLEPNQSGLFNCLIFTNRQQVIQALLKGEEKPTKSRRGAVQKKVAKLETDWQMVSRKTKGGNV